MSEKRRECFFLHGAHDQLTKRDDIRKAMDEYLGNDEVNYGLYQGRRAVSDDNQKIYFRALFFDVSHENFESEYIALQAAFTKAKQDKSTILCNYE